MPTKIYHKIKVTGISMAFGSATLTMSDFRSKIEYEWFQVKNWPKTTPQWRSCKRKPREKKLGLACWRGSLHAFLCLVEKSQNITLNANGVVKEPKYDGKDYEFNINF